MTVECLPYRKKEAVPKEKAGKESTRNKNRKKGNKDERTRITPQKSVIVLVQCCVLRDMYVFHVKGGHFVNMQPHSLSERRPPFPLSSFFTESCGVELILTCIYRRIDLGKLENGDCSLVRTSTIQRQLQGWDLYRPMKLFIVLTCS